MLRNYRKPLIVVGPKVLLRAPTCVSSLEEMGPGTTWQPVLGDQMFNTTNYASAKILCFVSGKIYFDLVQEREKLGNNSSIAFIRLEELSPFPTEHLKKEIEKYTNIKDYYWLQEECQNQGAYSFVAPRLTQLIPTQVHFIKLAQVPRSGTISRASNWDYKSI